VHSDETVQMELSLRKTMPMEFRKYFGNKCVVIIDRFEIFIEKPKGLKDQAQTSGHHTNTTKPLNILLE
jgi:hypothetical protein